MKVPPAFQPPIEALQQASISGGEDSSDAPPGGNCCEQHAWINLQWPEAPYA